MILQSNPLLHWVPVSDDPGDDETSSDSSLDSMTLPPIHRTSSQRSISSRCSIASSCSVNHYRSPAAAALHQKSAAAKQAKRPSSLLVSSPPSSPRPASRSKSTDDYGSDTLATGSKRSLGPRRSTSSLSEEITISIPVPNTTVTGLGKLTRLKERLLNKSPLQQQQLQQGETAVVEDSDGESTPLVSELSSPSHSNSDSVFKGASPEDETSDSLSPDSTTIKNLHRGGNHSSTEVIEHYVDSVSLVVHESTSSSFGSRSLSRQNAQDWENPETPV